MGIGRKLTLLVAVPLLGLVAAAGVAVRSAARQAGQAEQARLVVVAASRAGQLAAGLEQERVAAVGVLTDGTTAALNSYLGRIANTDTAMAAVSTVAGSAGVPVALRPALAGMRQQADVLRMLRAQVQAGDGIALSAVAVQYRIAVTAVLSVRASAAQAGAPAPVADQLRAVSALAQAAEDDGEQQVAVLRAVRDPQLTPAAAQEITAARTGFDEQFQTFTTVGGPDWAAQAQRALSGPQILTAQQLQDAVARTPAGDRLRVNRQAWTAAVDARVARLHEVEQRFDAQIDAAMTHRRDDQRRLSAWIIAVIVVLALVIVVVTVSVVRRIVSRLKQVTAAARHVAYRTLPDAVTRLQDPETLHRLDAQRFADISASELPVAGRDEIAQVAAAFGVVEHKALLLAAEQAVAHRGHELRLADEFERREAEQQRLHLNVQKMMVTLARRNALLTGRASEQLDALQRQRDDDPGLFELIWPIDFAITRLQHETTNLLILGGQANGLVRGSDALLVDVLQGAVSRVEAYERVAQPRIETGVLIDRRDVDLLVHLVSLLLDNACSYSAPETVVQIDVRLIGDRVSVAIADRGIGMSAEQYAWYNQRLATPPPLGAEGVTSMGLLVAAHIARMLQLTIQLRPNHDRGTVALVEIPASRFQLVAAISSPARTAEGAPRLTARVTGHELAAPALVGTPLAVTAVISTADVLWQEQPVAGAQPPPWANDGARWALPAHVHTTELPQVGSTGQEVPGEQTRNGLARRRRGATLTTDLQTPGPAAPDLRDPAEIAAVMTAFTRGTGAALTPNSFASGAGIPAARVPADEQGDFR